ncbi:hypothetical protein AeMF1_014583 [Aphanomyces euteiches]|nr:hypothetical protein AeMF1_014583 [Aphanomyces euteiches]
MDLDLNRWKGSAADYARANSLADLVGGKVLNEYLQPSWSRDGFKLWFLKTVHGGGQEIHVVDIHTGVQVIDHDALHAALLSYLINSGKEDVVAIQFHQVEPVHDDLSVLRVRLDAALDLPWLHIDLATYSITEETSTWTGDAASSSSSAVKPMVSEWGGGDTTVEFVNDCPFSLEVLWIDGDGKPSKYHDVKPSDRVEQHTFVGHVWCFRHSLTRQIIAWHRAGSFERIRIQGVDSIELSALRPRAAKPAQTKDFNVFHDGVQLTFDGTADTRYENVVISPNGAYVACFKVIEPSETRQLTLIEHCPSDSIHPRVQMKDYAKPGDAMAQILPILIHIASKRQIPVATEFCATPYSMTQLTWHVSSNYFSFVYNPRGHKCLHLLAVDAATGCVRVVVEETSPTFVFHPNCFIHHLPDSNELIWTSDRSGFRHLYLYLLPSRLDALQDEPLVAVELTAGDFVVRKVVDVDYDRRRLLVAVAGDQVDAEDPYHLHYMFVHLDKNAPTRLTFAAACHDPPAFSPDKSVYLDRFSRVDLAPTTQLRRAIDGSLICVLDQADVSALVATGWSFPQRLAFSGRDHRTLIYGVVVFPLHYDHTTPLHVVEHIYAGPHDAFVPKRFGLHLEMLKLAELGFCVVQIDGMGTAHRSKAFHDVCHRNLIDSGLPDRKLWIQSLAHIFPLDISRGVGIYGGSAGGQSAVAALLTHGDLYTVAVADCGCHDNRVDKLWWNELWMGVPDDDDKDDDQVYKANANATHAAKLMPHQRLLLVVGMLDDNVDPACTFQLVQAFIDADKDVDLVCFPKGGHGAGGSRHGTRRRFDYFVRHLKRVEPRQTYSAV